MSPNHAKTPHVFNNRKEGSTCSKTCSDGLYILYIYMNIKVCSYFNLLISEILDRYMIFPGLIRESLEYSRRLS